jgi:tetratricopeptide (TPR) repeat protein
MAESNDINAQQMQARLEKMVAQWSQGKITLKHIVGLNESELYAIASQAYFFFLQGKNEPARILFEGLVALDPRNAYYYRALGAVYWRLKEAQKALRQFTYAIKVSPQDISSYVNRAEVYVYSKQFDQARRDLNYAIEHAAPHEQPLQDKARAILKMLDGSL